MRLLPALVLVIGACSTGSPGDELGPAGGKADGIACSTEEVAAFDECLAANCPSENPFDSEACQEACAETAVAMSGSCQSCVRQKLMAGDQDILSCATETTKAQCMDEELDEINSAHAACIINADGTDQELLECAVVLAGENGVSQGCQDCALVKIDGGGDLGSVAAGCSEPTGCSAEEMAPVTACLENDCAGLDGDDLEACVATCDVDFDGFSTGCLVCLDGAVSQDPSAVQGCAAEPTQAPCCDPAEEPSGGIEGVHCCANGEWRFDIGNGSAESTCAGADGVGQVCELP
jgi:hypothetical protein